MQIWKHEQKFTAIAEKGKVFKVQDADGNVTYRSTIEVRSEADAEQLVEVYFANGKECDEKTFRRFQILSELKEIRLWFEKNDYIPNKVVVGEWSLEDERFVTYCAERTKKRARQDELNTLLGITL